MKMKHIMRIYLHNTETSERGGFQ